MDMSKEIFVYLGIQKDVVNLMVMMHLQVNNMSTEQIVNACGQVYIALINDGLIYSTGGPKTIPYLLIYNILRDGSVLPVIINHISSPTGEFPPGVIDSILYKVFKAPRKPDQITAVVSVKVKDGIPLLMEVFDIPIPEETRISMRDFKKSSSVFKPLGRSICTKPVPKNNIT